MVVTYLRHLAASKDYYFHVTTRTVNASNIKTQCSLLHQTKLMPHQYHTIGRDNGVGEEGSKCASSNQKLTLNWLKAIGVTRKLPLSPNLLLPRHIKIFARPVHQHRTLRDKTREKNTPILGIGEVFYESLLWIFNCMTLFDCLISIRQHMVYVFIDYYSFLKPQSTVVIK